MTTLVLPANMPKADAYWWHEDTRGMQAGATSGLNRALSGDWSSGSKADRVADWLDYLALRSWIAGRLSGAAGAGSESGEPLIMAPDYAAARGLASTNPRARAVALIGQSGIALARQVPGLESWTPPRIFVTGHPGENSDTGFPLIAIAIVTVIVAVAESAAVAYLAHEAAPVIDNWLSRDATTKQMVQADAQVLKVLDVHASAETTAGKALPLSDAEVRALDELEARQKVLLNRQPPPVSNAGDFPWWSLPAAAAAGFVIAKFL